jgi:hypothetical protein
MSPRKPDFVVAGFPRCGTTWLYEVLRLHPLVFLPVRKEINFFNRAYEKGLDWYTAYFAEARSDQRAGDISPVYAEYPEVPERILATVPDVKLILIIRSHVPRLRSSYWQLKRDGRSNDDLIDFLEGRSERSPYLELQRYAPLLESYLRLFDRRRILIVLYEDLRKDPHGIIDEIVGFLGLEPGAYPEAMTQKITEHVNPTFSPRWPALYLVAMRVNQKLRRTHIRLLDRPLALGKRLFFALSGRRRREEVGNMPGEDRLRAFFAEDVAALERLLGRPLRELWQ